jgi:phosphohistidine phosphatase SixA
MRMPDRGVRWRIGVVAALVLGAVGVGVAAWPPAARATQGMTADDLRRGGYVIFFRHGLADQGSDQPLVDFSDCSTQRNLNEQGMRDARAIGDAFRKLAIPVDRVITSEFCRALETAYIAFRRAEPEPRLNLCCMDTHPFSVEDRDAFIRNLVTVPPPTGTNTVIVAHGTSIMADLAQGEAAIYLPDGQGGAVRLARVLPSEWMAPVYAPGGMR